MNGKTQALDRLITPRSIAVIGASEKTSTLAGLSLVNLVRYGFSGELYPVNPRHSELCGLTSYPAITDVPTVPDTAIVVVPAHDVLNVVRDSVGVGIRTFTILSSGFGEGADTNESAARKRDLLDYIRSENIRVLGPNSIGVINVRDQVVQRAAAFLPPEMRAGEVAFISQSGGASLIAFNRAQSAGVGASFVIPTGNEFDIDVNDAFEFVCNEGSSKVVCLFLESIKDGLRLIEIGRRAHAAGISVFAIKVGSSTAGNRAVSAHTGAVSGQDDVYNAALAQAGIVRVDDLDMFHETARIIVERGRPASNRVAAICVSGGEAAWIADEAAKVGLELPRPDEKTSAALQARLRFGASDNPLDLTGQLFSGDQALADDALSAITADDNYDALLLAVPTLGRNVSKWLAPVVADVQGRTDKPVLVSWWGVGGSEAAVFDNLRDLGVTAFDTPYRALGALAAAARSSRPLPERPANAATAGSRASASVLEEQVRAVVPFPPTEVADSVNDAFAAAQSLGLPVVIKVVADDLQHKTELGAVAVNLRTADDVTAVLTRLDGVRRGISGGRFEIQRFLTGAELLVSGRYDPTFGPVITIGAGGIWTELIADASTMLAPLSEDAVTRVLSELRIGRILAGYRNSEALDVPAAARAITAFSEVVAGFGPEVLSVELNPMIVTAEGAFAVDLLVETH